MVERYHLKKWHRGIINRAPNTLAGSGHHNTEQLDRMAGGCSDLWR